MAKLKGVWTLEKKMTKIFHTYVPNSDDVKLKLSTDFCYMPTRNIICFPLVISNRSDRLFAKFIQEEYEFLVDDVFVLSLLHEFGHYLTLDEIDDEEYNYSKDLEDSINNRLEEDEDNDDVYSEYFYLPIEKIATDTGIAIFFENTLEMYDMYVEMGKAIQEFYKRNKVTE